MRAETAVAAANLRSSGMSEQAIYHAFKRVLVASEAPSYRDLRRVWKKYKVTRGALRGKKGAQLRDGKLVTKGLYTSYPKKRAAGIEVGRFTVRGKVKETGPIDDNFAGGYLVREGVPREAFQPKAQATFWTYNASLDIYEEGY